MVEETYKFSTTSPCLNLLTVNTTDKQEFRSIFQLINSKDKTKVIKTLINSDNMFNPSELNENGETVFIVACKCKKIANAFALLDVYGEKCIPHFIDSKGYNAIYYISTSAANLIDRILQYPTGLSSLSHVYPNGDSILIKFILDGRISQAENIIQYLDIDNLNHVNNNGKNALILACELEYFSIATALINRKVVLTFYDSTGNSALSYLLQKINVDLTKERANLALSFIGLDNTRNEVKRDFIRYETGRFTCIRTLPKSASGNFGKMKWAIDSVTGEHKILKWYSNYIGFITDDIIKEIVFIKQLNSNSNSVVRIDGIYIDEDNNFHIVIKPLAMTLYNYFKLLSAYDAPQISRINDLFSKMEKIMMDIHLNGISHNDAKLENIMFDYSGNVYMIDFGISDFIGISPYRNTIDNYITTSYIKAPDSDSNIKFTIVKETESSITSVENLSPKKIKQYKEIKSFTFKVSRKSYCSDIYSLGVSFIQGILTKSARFISNSGIIYKVIKNEEKEKSVMIIEEISETELAKLKLFPFYEKIIRMINIDGNKRLERINSFNFPTEYVELPNRLINKSVHYKSNEIKSQMHELIYSDKIFETYSKTMMVMKSCSSPSNKDYVAILDKIVSFRNNNVSVDTYLNTLYSCVNYTGEEDKTIVCISYFYIFMYIFEWFGIEIEQFSNLFEIPEHILSGKINSVIISLIPSITFLPFNMLISRMIVILQNNAYESDLIVKMEDTIYNNIIDYIVSKAEKEDVYIWDFIQSFTYQMINQLPFEVSFSNDTILSVFRRF